MTDRDARYRRKLLVLLSSASPGWPIALAVGVSLALAALGLLTIVRRRAKKA